jgi:hypothetical protein
LRVFPLVQIQFSIKDNYTKKVIEELSTSRYNRKKVVFLESRFVGSFDVSAIEQIKALVAPIAQKYKLKALWAFGFYVQGEATEEEAFWLRRLSDFVGTSYSLSQEDVCSLFSRTSRCRSP